MLFAMLQWRCRQGIDPRVHRQLERNARRLDTQSALKERGKVEHRVRGSR